MVDAKQVIKETKKLTSILGYSEEEALNDILGSLIYEIDAEYDHLGSKNPIRNSTFRNLFLLNLSGFFAQIK